MLHPGLYEQVINNALTGELAEIPEARKSVAPIDKAEASKVLAQYLADDGSCTVQQSDGLAETELLAYGNAGRRLLLCRYVQSG